MVDFTFYGLIPLAVTTAYPSELARQLAVLLEATFFVNAAGLFFLSALIEKNQSAQLHYSKTVKKEVTTLKMPPALMEGTESLTLFALILLFSEYQIYLYSVFIVGVTITIL